MIGFLPPLYEDELIYSWLARYMVYSGYTSVSDAYVDIYGTKTTSPSELLINNMTTETAALMNRYKPMKELVLHHTMFPEYARFMEPEKRERLLSDCGRAVGNWSNIFRLPASDDNRYLKYCPECVKEDRERYGETYWHRVHQIYNIRICIKHRTYLVNSPAAIKYDSTRLKNAEIIIPEDDASEICDDKVILSLACYLEKVFYDGRYSNDRIGLFLNDRIDKEYIHDNGDRKIYALYDKYIAFYLPLGEGELMTVDYMGKLLRGGKGAFYFICQLGMFLGIKAEDLLGYEFESDDRRVFRVVAERLNEPIEVVVRIGTAILNEYKNNGGAITRRARSEKRLEEDDIRLLKDVKTICAEIYGQGHKRPRKVTVKTVSRALGIDPHKMNKMRLCLKEIDRYYETQEHYWAREIIWAVRQIQKDDDALTITHIHRYTNIRKEKILDSMQELKEMDGTVYRMVCNVL